MPHPGEARPGTFQHSPPCSVKTGSSHSPELQNLVMEAWEGENHTERSGSGGGRLREREGRSGSPVWRNRGTCWRGRDRALASPVASPLLSFQASEESERPSPPGR